MSLLSNGKKDMKQTYAQSENKRKKTEQNYTRELHWSIACPSLPKQNLNTVLWIRKTPMGIKKEFWMVPTSFTHFTKQLKTC